MAFIEKLSEKIASGATSISNSAKKAGDNARLNSELNQNKRTIDDLYLKLGKLVKERLISEIGDYEAISLAAEIDRLFARNEEISAEISVLKGKRYCSKCGALLAPEALFCHECGTKNEQQLPAPPAAAEVSLDEESALLADKEQKASEEAEAPAESAPVDVSELICPKCGSHEKPNAVFCSGCGARMVTDQ